MLDVANVRADENKFPNEVAAMFDVVAPSYDLANDLLSLGQVYLWRRATRNAIDPQPGALILDVAGGTGTSAAILSRSGADVVVCDISRGMIEVGEQKHPEVDFVLGSATDLPFDDDTFDAVTISFGIRNVEDVPKALEEMYRVTKPGGRIVICEFSTPIPLVRPPHNFYLRQVAPRVARLASAAGGAYDYLSESILEWYDQDALGAMMDAAGWQDISYRNLTYGTVALHRGFKPLA
ncbi:class I SAM-dependent methyltransferase [Actinomyces minihominis]|uniref:class I SAM-dependent methyltransferase n=1 Tax=Actinomyces minihominis TaxID=2002838 RepID=UPI000C088DAF|nr:class I SAM-dependent methyltransferase [Actinomyces minihominis]